MTDELITPHDLNRELIRLSKQLDADHSNLIRMCSLWAHADNAYRLSRAKRYIVSQGTVAERAAQVDLETGSERLEAHTAEGMKVAALERVRSTRAQLSACQSVANAVRSEVEMAGRL